MHLIKHGVSEIHLMFARKQMEYQLNTQTILTWPSIEIFSPFLKEAKPQIVSCGTTHLPAFIALATDNLSRVLPQSQDESEDNNEY